MFRLYENFTVPFRTSDESQSLLKSAGGRDVCEEGAFERDY